MCSLVMSPFSCEFIKMEIDLLQYHKCFNLPTMDTVFTYHGYSIHTAPFFDGRTSILVIIQAMIISYTKT